jgi:hypothetical protein
VRIEMVSKLLLLIFTLLVVSHSATALEVPRQLSAGRSDFTYHALGDACYSMDVYAGGLPCNPAFVGRPQKGEFNSHIFFGNDVTYFDDIKSILNNEADVATVHRVANNNRGAEFEADLEAGYIKEKFAMSVSPSRLNYYSLIRDPVLPEISLYASQEQVLRLQFASEINKDLDVGVQVRGVQRRFILSEFFIPEAMVEGGSNEVTRINEQKIVYLEPGMVWAPEGEYLSPQFSATVTQLGYVDRKYDGLSTSPEGQIGGSIRPAIDTGSLELGTQVTLSPQYQRWTELVRLAGSYKLGIARYSGSFNENQFDLAVDLKFKGAHGGVVMDYRKSDEFASGLADVRTFYFELGAEI